MKYAFCCLLALCLLRCTDPIVVGSDILGADDASLGRTSELSFTTRTVADDSLLVIAFDENVQEPISLQPVFTFGFLSDPIFGEWRHDVYFAPDVPSVSGIPTPPSFAKAGAPDNAIDSIVMILPIDTSQALYGPGRSFSVEVRQLEDEIEQGGDFFSDATFPVRPGTINDTEVIIPNFAGRLISDTIYGDSIVRPHLRVRLDQQLVDKFEEAGLDAFTSIDNFQDFFPGVRLSTTAVSDALVFVRPNPANQRPISGFNIYFEGISGVDTLYRIPFDFWVPSYQRDYGGSLAETLLEEAADNDLTLVGGQASVLTEIVLDDLGELDDRIVNKAEFTFTLQQVDGYDYADYREAGFLGLFYRNDEGALVPIVDGAALTGSSPNLVENFLGGFVDRDDPNTDGTYSLNLTVHLQRILDGELPNQLFLRSLRPGTLFNTPDRVILGGPEAVSGAARFTVTFTELER